MKFSVVIAACNGEKYIAEQLQSLVQQSRPPDEVLIGDDSPGEALKNAVAAFRESSQQLPFDLKYIKNPVQRGVNGNFYSLACAATGDIIFFCDQDDFWLPEKIRRLSETFEQEPQCEAVCCFSFWTDAQLKPWAEQDETEPAALQCNPRKSLFELFLRWLLAGSGHNIAIRKSIVAQLPMWDDTFLYDSWIVRSCSAAGTLKFIPERLTLHRIHGNNLTVTPTFRFGTTLAQRARSNGTEELSKLLAEWVLFRKNLSESKLFEKVSSENVKLLDQYIAYLEKRLYCRRKGLIMRTVFCLLMLPGYFRFGNKFRSAARDIAGL